EGPSQDLPSEQGGPEGNLALVPPRREDRRPRDERRGQEHAPQDHGEGRDILRGRGVGGGRSACWLPPSGASARSREERPRQRRGGGGGGPRPPGPLRRAEREAGRESLARRNGKGDGR